jgi:hypothetical protein
MPIYPCYISKPSELMASNAGHVLSSFILLNPYLTFWAKFYVFLFYIVQKLLIFFINSVTIVPCILAIASEFVTLPARHIHIFFIKCDIFSSVREWAPNLIGVCANHFHSFEIAKFIDDIFIIYYPKNVIFRVCLSASDFSSLDVGYLAIPDISSKHVSESVPSKSMAS